MGIGLKHGHSQVQSHTDIADRLRENRTPGRMALHEKEIRHAKVDDGGALEVLGAPGKLKELHHQPHCGGIPLPLKQTTHQESIQKDGKTEGNVTLFNGENSPQRILWIQG